MNAELQAERESKQLILNEIEELRNENNELKDHLELLKFKVIIYFNISQIDSLNLSITSSPIFLMWNILMNYKFVYNKQSKRPR